MADTGTIFTRIIRGELPGRFVWRDDQVVAFLTIAPLRPGHVLVVPIDEIDRWTDVPPDTWLHVCDVSQRIATVLERSFDCTRVGLIIAGLEVPHCHVHLVPIQSEADLDFARADHNADGAALDAVAERIREGLRAAGYDDEVSSASMS